MAALKGNQNKGDDRQKALEKMEKGTALERKEGKGVGEKKICMPTGSNHEQMSEVIEYRNL